MIKSCEYCGNEAIHGITIESCNNHPIGTLWFCQWSCLFDWLLKVKLHLK